MVLTFAVCEKKATDKAEIISCTLEWEEQAAVPVFAAKKEKKTK